MKKILFIVLAVLVAAGLVAFMVTGSSPATPRC